MFTAKFLDFLTSAFQTSDDMTFLGVPLRNACTLLMTTRNKRLRASSVAQAM